MQPFNNDDIYVSPFIDMERDVDMLHDKTDYKKVIILYIIYVHFFYL